MGKKAKVAISPTREEDYPEWYQQVIKAADLAESSPVRGCMVIKPWGYGIWEHVQQALDKRIKATGHENAYFPLFIPLSFLEKEAEHVEGFAKECAVVTHHRLEERDGQLVPTGELEEPLIVRPTSETIIGASFAKWVQSYRDLPLLINQWANVVRWEMRPRIFLRTAEFLWQEGHTVHASEQEAREETMQMLEVYREVAEDVLALPVIVGEKTAGERFPGAVNTYCIEAMMQDRKALQAGTSHYLGTNFAKASGIQFLNAEGELVHAHTTSWGVSTRLIGGVIMTHGDDNGLRVPPAIAPKQVAILPVLNDDKTSPAVLEHCVKLRDEIVERAAFRENPVAVTLDDRDLRGGEKSWQWVKRGVPLRLEVGPRDLENGMVMLRRRDKEPRWSELVARDAIVERLSETLEDIQNAYFEEAKNYQQNHLVTDIDDFGSFQEFFTPRNKGKPEIHGGFVRAKWCGSPESEELLKELKVTIRCLPFDQSETSGKCVLTGKEAHLDAIFAKSY